LENSEFYLAASSSAAILFAQKFKIRKLQIQKGKNLSFEANFL
jgi:hypothetical protein